MDASEFEGTQFGATGPTVEPEWQRPAEAAVEARLAQALNRNIDLAQAFLNANAEIAALREQLKLARETADDLAELVAVFIRVLQVVKPQFGNGVRAAFEAALAEAGVGDESLYGGA